MHVPKTPAAAVPMAVRRLAPRLGARYVRIPVGIRLLWMRHIHLSPTM